MMKKAIYPGSFDPVTNGHVDMIERASKIVDELVVGVLNNSAKNSLFSLDERVSMLKEITKDMPNVTVDCTVEPSCKSKDRYGISYNECKIFLSQLYNCKGICFLWWRYFSFCPTTVYRADL